MCVLFITLSPNQGLAHKSRRKNGRSARKQHGGWAVPRQERLLMMTQCEHMRKNCPHQTVKAVTLCFWQTEKHSADSSAITPLLHHHSTRTQNITMLTLLTNINHIKAFKNNKIWNPSSIQRLVIADPSPGGYGSGLTLVLHGEL